MASATICEFCGGDLVETGQICSGNVKYATYECKNCYKETCRCNSMESIIPATK